MRFSPWQLAIGLITLCAVAVGLSMYLRREVDLPPAQLIRYLPKQDTVTGYLDLRPLRYSGLLQKLVGSNVSEEPEYKEFVERTGFDYKNDLDAILWMHLNEGEFFVLKGRFDWKSLKRYAQQNGGSCSFGYCTMPASRPNRYISFYALSDTVMSFAVSSDENGAKEVRAGNGGPPISPPSAPLWVSVPGKTLAAPDKLPQGTAIFAKALSYADRITFTLGQKDERLELGMQAFCKNEESASVLRAQLVGLTTMFQKLLAQGGQQPDPANISSVLSSGVFEKDQRTLIGRWPVEMALIDALGGG